MTTHDELTELQLREAQERERRRRQEADTEAVKTMTEEQVAAARWSGLSPSEYLYWAGRR